MSEDRRLELDFPGENQTTVQDCNRDLPQPSSALEDQQMSCSRLQPTTENSRLPGLLVLASNLDLHQLGQEPSPLVP